MPNEKTSRRFLRNSQSIQPTKTSLIEPLEARTLLSTTITPIADTYARAGSYAATNFGNSTELWLKNDANASYVRQSFLKFDLGAPGAVSSASLTLTPIFLGSSASTTTIRVRLITDASDAWIEGNGGTDNNPTNELTWYKRPSATSAYITFSGASLKLNTPFTLNVASLINQSGNTNRTVGFVIDVISAANSQGHVGFASRESATASTRPTLTFTAATSNTAPTLATPASASTPTVTGKTVSLSVLGADDAGEANLKYTWLATAVPSGASAPTFSANATNAAKNTLATFSRAGAYTFTVTITDAAGLSTTSLVNVTVNQTLTSIAITPGAVTLTANSTQQFAASAKDQFNQALAVQPLIAWSASAGSITTAGLYTAPASGSSATVSASAAGLSASSTVTLSSLSLTIADPQLNSLTASLFADGALSRTDIIQILRAAGSDDGLVDATEFADLKYITSNSAYFHIPSYVQVLSSDVVNGNAANVSYLGQSLGNLVAGSSATQLNNLVSKWFYGADHPAAGTYTYLSTAGSLFVNGPSYTDEHQGYLGDCYLIASLGSIAKSNPAAIQNMFVDNGDNTWTVRFYYNGVADYVTVDRFLPTSSGRLVYSNAGASATNTANELWMALAEKAYAQWNQTGKEGRNGTNSYPAIEGGWMANVDKQVLGKSAAGYSMSSSYLQTLIDALNANKAVTIGTTSAGGDGLYGSHAYSVLNYDAATATFQLYNPWGSNQPGRLTYAQLQADTSGFVVADTSTTTPIALTLASANTTLRTPSLFSATPVHHVIDDLA